MPRPRVLFATLLAGFALRLSAASFEVNSFGARGDGRTLDTGAINRAIDAAATAGGGTVEGTLLDGRCTPYPTEPSGRTAIGHIKLGTEIERRLP